MYSCSNVDGKCDTNSGLVLKSISFEDGTFNQVSDFGSCSRRFLVDNTGSAYLFRQKSNFRIEGGSRGTTKSRPFNKLVTTNDSKDGGSFETNEVADK
ncbi:MAG: hypothetical protein JNL74_07380 [Fibrobacteres bacterium]|nr:hypothetical protein [Fibrobacterota bacterium]